MPEFLPAAPRSESRVQEGDIRAEECDSGLLIITRQARQLMVDHCISTATVRSFGKAVVSRPDVERFVAGHPGSAAVERMRMSAAQRRVARTVSAAHREIPAAYAVVRVVAERLRQRLRDEAATLGYVGVPELVVKAIAARRQQFPSFFTRAVDSRPTSVRPGAHVGVTIDVGKGLYLPSVADADIRPLREVAADLLRFRRAAARGRFTEADLAGSNIALTIHTDADIVHARPLIFPGHVCALSLASMQRELTIQRDGSLTTREYFHLGMAYDHRLVDGRSAVAFLRAIRADLETN